MADQVPNLDRLIELAEKAEFQRTKLRFSHLLFNKLETVGRTYNKSLSEAINTELRALHSQLTNMEQFDYSPGKAQPTYNVRRD